MYVFMSINHEIFEAEEAQEGIAALRHVMEEWKKIPGIDCSFATTSFGGYSWEEWLKEVWWVDESYGFSSCIIIVAHSPMALSRWRSSEHYKIFTHIIPHFLHQVEDWIPPCVTFTLPL